MHALIIEDETLIALLIEDRLRALGYTSFDFAVSEEEAIAAAHRHRPNLITSDVRLAAGCGISAVAEICSERMIPVVFITATVAEVRERVSDAVVVEKPFAQVDLERALGATEATSVIASPSQRQP